MEFTKEQFEEIGPWHFHDLCFDSSDQEVMRKIFNLLPDHLQGTAVAWGCDDSVFRDDVYEYLVENQFDMTVEEYIESEIANNYFKKGIYQEFDFDKLKPKKYSFDIETEGDITVIDEDGAITTIPKYEGKNVLDKLLAQYVHDGYKKGELGVIMAPAGMGKTRKFDPNKGRYQEKIDAAIKANKKNNDA